MLLHRHRIIGAALDGGIVADDDAFAAGDTANAGDDAGAVDGVVIEAVGSERRQFEERRAGIDERHHPLARQELATRQMTLAGLRRAAFGCLGALRLELSDPRAHGGLVGAELF
jgi:hypothetical protein